MFIITYLIIALITSIVLYSMTDEMGSSIGLGLFWPVFIVVLIFAGLAFLIIALPAKLLKRYVKPEKVIENIINKVEAKYKEIIKEK